MSENTFTLQGSKIPVYNHYQLKVPELQKTTAGHSTVSAAFQR
ncbi:TPA: hypothetical protein ACX3IK_005094 [Klebsiella variicola]